MTKSTHKRLVHWPNCPVAENTVFTGLVFVGSETECTNVVCFDLEARRLIHSHPPVESSELGFIGSGVVSLQCRSIIAA
jgi:hypothetical protein